MKLSANTQGKTSSSLTGFYEHLMKAIDPLQKKKNAHINTQAYFCIKFLSVLFILSQSFYRLQKIHPWSLCQLAAIVKLTATPRGKGLGLGVRGPDLLLTDSMKLTKLPNFLTLSSLHAISKDNNNTTT